MKKETLTSLRKSPLYLNSLILHGNGKLLDYTNDDGLTFNYAQFNTRALKDCPFKSAGCTAVCYATKGNHVFPSVTESREHSFMDSQRADFAEAMVYTIHTEQKSKRYSSAVMLIRIHESGDFYSLQYLRKWVQVWKAVEHNDGVQFTVYTKSFKFFLMLSEEETSIVNGCLVSGRVAINLSLDDTTTSEQWKAYYECKKRFPKMNTYYCTEHVDNVKHDNVCDCADCAKCGKCNHGDGKTTVVKIHSASNADMKVYRENIKAEA